MSRIRPRTLVLIVGTAVAATAVATASTAAAMNPAPHRTLLADDRHAVRIAGVDRYDTAVQLATVTWSSSEVLAVFLTNGEKFPDALAAGSDVRDLGPVLLTRPDSLPAATIGFLQSNAPCQIAVIGGSDTISDAVLEQAAGYANPDAAKCRQAAPM